jgi:hypothetical protein
VINSSGFYVLELELPVSIFRRVAKKGVQKVKYSIYRILNTVNDKAYIGVSTAPKKRISAHMTGTGSKLIWKDVQEFGRGAFLTQIIEFYDDADMANRRMQTNIMKHSALHPSGYNKGIGGKGSSGHMWDIEQRAKISGSNNSRSKLTEDQVIDIYWDARSRSAISKEYGISTTMVTKIKKGQAWKNVTGLFTMGAE